jgi:hypothetical protein
MNLAVLNVRQFSLYYVFRFQHIFLYKIVVNLFFIFLFQALKLFLPMFCNVRALY